nr:hypothetical protein [Pseudomonas insulae]
MFRRRGEQCERLASRDFDASTAALPAAIEALEQVLAGQALRGRLDVLLSNQFTRFCLVPWSWDIGSPGEQERYARHFLEEIYGQSAEGWSVRLSPEATGRLRLAAAIPEDLLERLQALALLAGCRLMSVQPYLMAAFNRFRTRLNRSDFLFVVAEPGRCSLLLARQGDWVRVRSVSLGDSDAALATLLGREVELLEAKDAAPATLYLHAPGRPDLAAAAFTGAAPQLLVVEAAADDALHAMAMVGA